MYKSVIQKIPKNNSFISTIFKKFSELAKKEDIGEKYKAVINGFNKDWKTIQAEKEQYRIKQIKDELLPQQRAFIESLAKKQYKKKSEIEAFTPLSISEEWLDLQKQYNNQMPAEGTRFPQHEEIMKEFAKWHMEQNPNFGFGAAAPQAVDTSAKVEEKKEEKKEEKVKDVYDIELISFDAAKKIVLIKEVRGYTNLGLKEAKELVEKAPTTILKAIKRGDCDAILKKLAENGAVAKLK